MAVQVIGSERGESARGALRAAPRPHLYVIDLTVAPALPRAGQAPTVDVRRLALRRRRLSRRLRSAGEIAGWTAGSAALLATLAAGLAGLVR